MRYIIQGAELVIAFSGSVHFYPNTPAGFVEMVRDFRRSK